MKKFFTVRFYNKGSNTTLRTESGALDAVLDMAGRMLCSGELEAISVEVA